MGGPYTTPLGRIVQGDPYKPQQRRDQQGKPRVIEAGKPGAGQPDMQHFLALAIPKTDPEFGAFWGQILAEDLAAWPSWVNPDGSYKRPDFAAKWIDGDSIVPDKTGVKPCDREGWPGCWVWKFASKFAPAVKVPVNGVWVDSTGDPNAGYVVKCGDWARISFSTTSNNSAQTPGMYRNLEQIAFYKSDTAIASAGSGPSADERFGAPPPGSGPSATPGAPPAAGPGGQPSHPPAASPPAAPAASPPAPAAGPPPSATASPASPPPPPYDRYMATPAGPKMTAKAGATTYEAYKAANWTDEQLIAHGYMEPPTA